MSQRKKTTSAAQKTPAKYVTFRLTLRGVAGITLAAFCLFLWMFFLGMWAGRTIISPCPSTLVEEQAYQESPLPSTLDLPEERTAICVQPRERKKRISPQEPSLYQGP
ncbi:MAG: hypothetical protein D3908_04285 [Candidatus Electrothrix sp. AUS4]|nr:hypothetical protein [Candidatus Electrothrix sp. AUS4]